MMGSERPLPQHMQEQKKQAFLQWCRIRITVWVVHETASFFWLKDGTNDFLKDSITNLMPFVNPMRKKYFYEWKNDIAEQGLSEFFVKTVAFPIKLCYNCIHRRQVFLPHFIFTVHFMQKCHGIQQEAYNDPQKAVEDACRMEHILSAESFHAIKQHVLANQEQTENGRHA